MWQGFFFISLLGGWSGGAKVLCILHHWGVQLILAYSWARPAILVVGKGRGGMFLFLLFLHFHSCSSFFPVPLFHLLYSLFLSLFSLSLGDDTKWPSRVDVSLNPNTINYLSLESLEALAISEDSDQTVPMHSLIWIFTGCTSLIVVFFCALVYFYFCMKKYVVGRCLQEMLLMRVPTPYIWRLIWDITSHGTQGRFSHWLALCFSDRRYFGGEKKISILSCKNSDHAHQH